jgi:chorismate dehydratase
MQAKHRVGAVSYLNTTPLVWGMLHGPQREHVDLTFSIPSVCAEAVETGAVDIGLVPVAEIARQGLEIVPGVGIAALGAVRSILLFAKKPWASIQTFAADASSRTSVELAKIILRERFGVQPIVTSAEPDVNRMLADADAAMIIGDPALRLDPETLPFEWLDLGSEWLNLTSLPMVFAAWAGKRGIPVQQLQDLTLASYQFGRDRLEQIVQNEHAARGVTEPLALHYLRDCIRFDLGPRELKGMETFMELAGMYVR